MATGASKLLLTLAYWLLLSAAPACAILLLRPPPPVARSRAPISAEATPLRSARKAAPPTLESDAATHPGESVEAEEDDPLYSADVWLQRGDARYRNGEGYCASYRPFTEAGNHSRAVLLLAASSGLDEEETGALRSIADRVALSCECVVLLPTLEGAADRWPQAKLSHALLAAQSFVNTEHQAEALGVLAIGAAAGRTIEFLASGGFEAHALVALSATATAGSLARAGRELATPLLGISGAASAEGASALEELREALQVNSRLGEDYFIVPFDECGKDFLLRPSGAAQENEADRALSLATAWFDRYLPERLTQRAV